MSEDCTSPYIPPRRYYDPADDKPQYWDFRPWLNAKGYTIGTFEIDFNGAPLTLVASSHLAGIVEAQIAGVEDKKTYTVSCEIHTTGSPPKTLRRSVILIGRAM